jgi:hypothetical protein
MAKTCPENLLKNGEEKKRFPVAADINKICLEEPRSFQRILTFQSLLVTCTNRFNT